METLLERFDGAIRRSLVGTFTDDDIERRKLRHFIISDAANSIAGPVHFERTTIQRLGYLLERLGYTALTEALRNVLFAKSPVPWVQLEPMDRKQPNLGEPPLEKNERWRVTVHRYPEIDE